jgi:hypothetical protein
MEQVGLHLQILWHTARHHIAGGAGTQNISIMAFGGEATTL